MFRLRYTSDSLLISVNIFVFVVSRFLFWTFWLSNSSIDKTSDVDIYPTAVLLFEQSKCIDHIQFCFCTVTDSVSPFVQSLIVYHLLQSLTVYLYTGITDTIWNVLNNMQSFPIVMTLIKWTVIFHVHQ